MNAVVVQQRLAAALAAVVINVSLFLILSKIPDDLLSSAQARSGTPGNGPKTVHEGASDSSPKRRAAIRCPAPAG